MATLIEDIKAIRKHKKISLNELYERTKVPAHIIEMIDNGSIFAENPNNKTYIRSFIRTYVKGLGISNEDIIRALDDQEVDVYDGFLAEKYINEPGGDNPSGPSFSPDDSPESGSEKKTEAKSAKSEDAKKSSSLKQDKNTSASPKSSASHQRSESTDEPDLDKEDEIIRQTKSTHTSGSQSVDLRPDVTKPYNSRTPEPPNINTIDWADMVKRFNPLESNSKIYMTFASVVCVLLILVLVFYAFYQADSFPLNLNLGGSSTANLDEAVQLPIVPDNLAAEEEPEVEPELPDTLELYIYAANEKLEPVRVRSDFNNVLTPFWIEHGEALRIEFEDEIFIRGQYSRMALIFNGHVIENFRDFITPDQFVRISREYLNEDPKWKTTGSETIPSEVSSASEIIQAVAD